MDKYNCYLNRYKSQITHLFFPQDTDRFIRLLHHHLKNPASFSVTEDILFTAAPDYKFDEYLSLNGLFTNESLDRYHGFVTNLPYNRLYEEGLYEECIQACTQMIDQNRFYCVRTGLPSEG